MDGELQSQMEELGDLGCMGGDELTKPRSREVAGKKGSFLNITQGCLRGGNKDIQDMQKKIQQIEKERGHNSGHDPRIKDTIHVFDTTKGSK